MQRDRLKSVVKFILENATSTSPVEYKDILENVPIHKSTLSRITKKIKNRFSPQIRVETDPFNERRILFYLSHDGKDSSQKEPEDQLNVNWRSTQRQLNVN